MILRESFIDLIFVGRELFYTLLVLTFMALFHLPDGSGYKQGAAQVGWFLHDGVGSRKAVRAVKVLQSRQKALNDLLWVTLWDFLRFATV